MNFAIIGAGICGLLAAKNILIHNPHAQITIIDKSNEVGGLLSGHYYPDQNLYFDQGTHIPRETGNKVIDEFMVNAIPETDLIYYPKGKGDFSGAVYNQVLQNFSHFPDIRARADLDVLQNSINATIDRNRGSLNSPIRVEPVDHQGEKRFGGLYFNTVLSPILESLYQKNIEDLAWFALELPGLTRVIAHDFSTWESFTDDQDKRAIYAVPDQRKLPDTLMSPLRSFYTKRQGTKTFVESLEQALVKEGINFIKEASISRIDFSKNEIVYACDGKDSAYAFDKIIFATGVIAAAQLMGYKLQDYGFERPMSHRLVHLVAKKNVSSDLFYFYGLDPELSFYRITNYAAITNNPDDHRLTVEVLGERADTDDDLINLVLSELKQIGFINDVAPSFANVKKLPAGFPVPTVKNLSAMNELRNAMLPSLPPHAILAGIGAEPGMFFQGEIIEHVLKVTGASFQ